MKVTPDKDYDFIEPIRRLEKKGVQCGECGQKFDYDKAYGFVCNNIRCPIQLKISY